MAPLTRRRKAAAVAAAGPVIIDPADRLSKLPESILAEILSYLPAQEVVRTCVLARAWRHLWKFTPNLLIKGDSVQKVRALVDHLLRARLAGLANGGVGLLDACKIKFNPYEVEDMPIVNSWILLALACRVKSLCINMSREDDYGNHYFQMSSRRLISQHLTSLRLIGVCFSCECLDFSGCPALKRLEIHRSSMLGVTKLTSPSVRHLVITYIVCSPRYRLHICVPRVVLLELHNIVDRYPVLESMPELKEAYVQIDADYVDFCSCDDRMGCEHVMGDDHSSDDSDTEQEYDASGGQNTIKSMLLEGLSQAQDLTLMACNSTYIFRRDLRCCPTFPKLKTLLLDEYWCEPPDCRALVRLLEHTPVLEELTVIFWNQDQSTYNVELKGDIDATVESNMMSQCLKTVKVKCGKVDDSVLSIISYLSTLNICFQFSTIRMN